MLVCEFVCTSLNAPQHLRQYTPCPWRFDAQYRKMNFTLI